MYFQNHSTECISQWCLSWIKKKHLLHNFVLCGDVPRAVDECTLVTKSEFSRNLSKVKNVLFASEDYYSKFSSVSLFPRYTIYSMFHTSSLPDKYFLVSKTSFVFLAILTHRCENTTNISANSTHFIIEKRLKYLSYRYSYSYVFYIDRNSVKSQNIQLRIKIMFWCSGYNIVKHLRSNFFPDSCVLLS
jgi:hypothetical protein